MYPIYKPDKPFSINIPFQLCIRFLRYKVKQKEQLNAVLHSTSVKDFILLSSQLAIHANILPKQLQQVADCHTIYLWGNLTLERQGKRWMVISFCRHPNQFKLWNSVGNPTLDYLITEMNACKSVSGREVWSRLWGTVWRDELFCEKRNMCLPKMMGESMWYFPDTQIIAS